MVTFEVSSFQIASDKPFLQNTVTRTTEKLHRHELRQPSDTVTLVADAINYYLKKVVLALTLGSSQRDTFVVHLWKSLTNLLVVAKHI